VRGLSANNLGCKKPLTRLAPSVLATLSHKGRG
jgi:hypothetical protein